MEKRQISHQKYTLVLNVSEKVASFMRSNVARKDVRTEGRKDGIIFPGGSKVIIIKCIVIIVVTHNAFFI